MGKASRNKNQPRPLSLPATPQKWSKTKKFWTAVVFIVGSTFSYMKSLPNVDFVSLALIEPFAPDSPFLLKGQVKNFGPTTARNYFVRTRIEQGPSTVKPERIDFEDKADSHGQVFHPSVFDLAPNQETVFFPGKTLWSFDKAAYDEVMADRRYILFFAQVNFQDLLFIPHSKILCFKYDRVLKDSLAHCTTADYPY
jgi:hypothetical protein